MIRTATQQPTASDAPNVAALLDRRWSDEGLAALTSDGWDTGTDAAGVSRVLWEEALLGPVRDMLGRPGKQLRGDMVSLAWRLAGGQGAAPVGLIQLIEVIHAGSLVIDDIQDNSSQRRGAACLHRLHGVPLSINAGNWMYFWSLELIDELGLGTPTQNELRRIVGRAMFRCHFGQALDLSVNVGRVPQRWLPGVVATSTGFKTGTLMELGALLGAVAAGAATQRREVLGRFGRRLGVGLQMLDDLANLAPVTGGPPAADGAALDKRHEDLRLARPTWPWAWASEELDPVDFAALQAEARVVHARAQAREAGREGTGALEARRDTEGLAGRLRDAIALRGRRAVRGYLERAAADLEAATGPVPELRLVTSAIERLEAAYVPRG